MDFPGKTWRSSGHGQEDRRAPRKSRSWRGSRWRILPSFDEKPAKASDDSTTLANEIPFSGLHDPLEERSQRRNASCAGDQEALSHPFCAQTPIHPDLPAVSALPLYLRRGGFMEKQ
jgi:hypothetical protein